MTVFQWIRFVSGAMLTLGGLFFLVTAVVGNFRFPFVLYRMHAAGIGDTLGLLLLLSGLVLLGDSFVFAMKLLLIVALFWLGSPVVTQFIMKMEINSGKTADGKKEGRTK